MSTNVQVCKSIHDNLRRRVGSQDVTAGEIGSMQRNRTRLNEDKDPVEDLDETEDEYDDDGNRVNQDVQSAGHTDHLKTYSKETSE